MAILNLGSPRIPIRMRRPSAAREALGFIPLVQAGWTDASRVESVPRMTALAEPFVGFAGGPAAQRATDARGFGRVGLLLLFKLAVWNDDRIGSDWTHACSNRTAQPARIVF
jgi:hypothetical protein